MKESKFYQEIHEEGRLEGQRETRRAAILEVLEARFGPNTREDYADGLGQIADLERLSELLKLASNCPRLTDFRKAFAKIRK